MEVRFNLFPLPGIIQNHNQPDVQNISYVSFTGSHMFHSALFVCKFWKAGYYKACKGNTFGYNRKVRVILEVRQEF